MFPYKAIVLIGMSGVGKTHWANFYGKERSISADEQIADSLLQQLPTVEGAEGGEKIDRLAAFVGKFGAERYGGLAREEFFRRQEFYLEAEREVLMEGLSDFLHTPYNVPLPWLYDTTGSFCEIFPKRAGGGALDPMDEIFLGLTKSRACIAYLACGQEEKKILLDRQLKRPKPMVYDREFFEACLKDYKQHKSVAEEKIVPDDFLRFVFPRAIEHRHALYAELADVTLTTAELERLTPPAIPSLIEFPKRFVSLVESKLQRVPATERTAKEQPQEQATSS